MEATNEHVVLGVSLLRISQPVFVAADRGLFAKHGLDVELRRFDTAQPLADEIGSGRIDAGGYVAYPILFGPKTDAHVRVTTAIVEDATHPLSFLLVRKGSALHDVRALEGKKVGILPTTAYRTWLEAVLRLEGADPSKVTMVPIAPQLEVDALARGGVDALFTGDPMATTALERGTAELLVPWPLVPRALGEPFLFGTFAFSEKLVLERPRAARAIRDALDDAIGVLASNPAAGREAMRSYVREAERPFVDRYADTKYFRSNEVSAAALDRALELTGTAARSADVALP